ncbi:MAG: sigma-54 dependent transcriptional regulator [Casimicrobiaceae bacterium]
MHADGTLTVLVVNADARGRASLERCLEDDYRVMMAASVSDAAAVMEHEAVDLLLCDQRMPQVNAVEFFRQTRISHPEAIRVLITGDTDHKNLIRSINEAAVYQIVPKPWQPDQVRLLVKRALESRELARRHRYLSRELKFADAVLRDQNKDMMKLLRDSYEFDKLVFASDRMVDVCNLARKGAVTDLPVLIEGETGTGKELMARAVHFFSHRKEFPFLAQNCGALPDDLLHSELFGHRRGAFTGAISDRLGLLPAADGGTVFLDEISEVSPSFQVSLLRFLQEGECKPLGTHLTRHCNVRVIAASNRPLKALVEQNKFRRDLYYRLRGFELLIPPLRDRPEDIPVLAEYVAKKYAESIRRRIAGISTDVIERLKTHTFPGNVRELENEVRRMVALAGDGDFLSVRHMSPEYARLNRPESPVVQTALLGGKVTLKENVETLEKHLVSQSLLRHKWNHSRAARELGISRVGLANKIRRYELDKLGV